MITGESVAFKESLSSEYHSYSPQYHVTASPQRPSSWSHSLSLQNWQASSRLVWQEKWSVAKLKKTLFHVSTSPHIIQLSWVYELKSKRYLHGKTKTLQHVYKYFWVPGMVFDEPTKTHLRCTFPESEHPRGRLTTFRLRCWKVGSDGVFPQLTVFPDVTLFSKCSPLNGYPVILPEKPWRTVSWI